MRTLSAFICILAAAISCAALPPEAAFAAGWEFSSAVNYDTGKYGSKKRTDSVYIPFTVKRSYLNAGFSVTVPYLRQSSRGLVTRVGGKPVRAIRGTGAAINSAASGLGDIMVNCAYTLKLDGPRSFDLGLAGKLKLPTASHKKWLGTGEPDIGAGLEFAKEITPDLTLLSDGYYTVVGDPDGVNFNNEVMLDVGFYSPLLKKVGLTVLYETRSAVLDGNADPRSVSATLSYSGTDSLQFAGRVTLGLSDGSPGLGIGAGFNRKF
ncbi:MAG: transporter [Elusimicrobiota bacterium]|nr:transporter [Elusimicrobiota bacterium]